MTETEKRRIELLNQTRKMYSNTYQPAVHPRYQAAYNSIYANGRKENQEETHTGTFGVRLMIAALLFCLFISARHAEMETETVSNYIQQEFSGSVDFLFFD